MQQDRTSHDGFGKDAGPRRREKQAANTKPKAHALPKFPSGDASPASIIKALKAVTFHPPRARTSFASGRCVRGTYAASDRATEVTKCRSFTRPSRVLARFSVDGSNPGLRGFSFHLGDDEDRSDILTQSAPVHFARTPEQMLAFLTARAPGPNGKPDMKKVRAFSAANPETLRQASYIAAHPLPPGFAGTTYWGVHAFPVTNAKGETRFIKFKVVPIGAGARTAARAKTAPADDLEARIAAGEVRFSVIALLDRPGDTVMDVTVRWRDEERRDAVRLGTIVITGVEAEKFCEASAFDPGHLAEGIAHPPDEIFAARRAAYAIAQAKRR